jgi:acid phosphatase (class A)
MNESSRSEKMNVLNADFKHHFGRSIGLSLSASLMSLMSLFGATPAHALEFVTSQAISADDFPPPPAQGSEMDEADLAKVLELQSVRTYEQCVRASKEVELSFATLFGPPYGPLSFEEVLAGRPLYLKLVNDTEQFTNLVRAAYRRERPFQKSTSVQTCLPRQESTSYPSNHAANARIAALVFSLVYPERAEQLMARADEVALDRVIGGVHFPSDIEAGKSIADNLFAQMKETPKFIALVELAIRARPKQQ